MLSWRLPDASLLWLSAYLHWAFLLTCLSDISLKTSCPSLQQSGPGNQGSESSEEGKWTEPRGNRTGSGLGFRHAMEQGAGIRLSLLGSNGGSWREGRSRAESKFPPLLPPPSTAPSKPEKGGLKIAPEAQLPAGRPGDLLGSTGRRRAGSRKAGRRPPRTRLPGHHPRVLL